ncbi:TPA: flippase [Photobacterium damselae]
MKSIKYTKKTLRHLNYNNDIRKIINNSGWLLFDKLSRLGIGLIVTAWVARYLGPNEYGKLAYVLAYLAFFQAVCILGLDNIVVRDIARNKLKSGEIIGTTFLLRILSGVILWFISVAVMVFNHGISSQITIITALCAFSLIFQVSDTIDLWFQSQSNSKRTVIVKLSSYLISNTLKVCLILNNATIEYFAAVIAIEGGISFIGLIFSYMKFPAHKLSISRAVAIKLLKESWPYIFSSLSIIVYMRIDQLMIKGYLGDKELGIYAAILPFAMIWTFIPTTLTTSLAPFIAKKKKEGEDEYWRSLRNIFRLYAILGWVICLCVVIAAPFVIKLLFSDAYSDGVFALQIIVFTNLFINMGVAQSLWILNEEKSRIAMYKTILGAIVCVVSNMILIPFYGIYGAAVSAVLAQLVSTIISNIYISRKIFILQLKSLFFIK